jgi:hypothetical protein
MVAECEKEFEKDDAERLQKGDAEEGIDRDSTWVKRLGESFGRKVERCSWRLDSR